MDEETEEERGLWGVQPMEEARMTLSSGILRSREIEHAVNRFVCSVSCGVWNGSERE